MKRDFWDKMDIVIKFFAGVLTPIAVAFGVWLWNIEKTQRETAAQMIAIAVSILTIPPDTQDGPNALRDWAIDVLRDPYTPPRLTAAAAADLQTDPIGPVPLTARELVRQLNGDDDSAITPSNGNAIILQ